MGIIEDTLKDKRYTDIRLGSDSTREFSNGNTLPLVGSPHGNNYLTLKSREDSSFFFNPNDRRLLCLRLTHQPSPWMGDFSYLEILPFSENEYVRYEVGESILRPNFSILNYENGDKLTFSGYEESFIISLNSKANGKIRLGAEGLSLEKKGNYIYGKVINFTECEDDKLTMYIKMSLDKNFDLKKEGDGYYILTSSKNLKLKAATSFISNKMAAYNYYKSPDNLEEMITASKKAWDKYFDIFKIENKAYSDNFSKYDPYNREDQVKFFYHCVYRAFLFPMKFYEVDESGKAYHYNTKDRKVYEGKYFTNIGFWDGQKTLFPLLSLIAKKDLEDILEGILNFYKETTYLPKWLSPDERGMMPGTLVDNIIADSLSKGIGLDKARDFLYAMIETSNKEDPKGKYGRLASKIFRDLGYIPSNYYESVNQSLDNCLSDYSISVVCDILGEDEIRDRYRDYSHTWTKLFDKKTKFLLAKDKDGNFQKDFDPLAWGSPYTEGSAYQNSYNTYNDYDKLIELFTSKEAFERRLDRLSNMDSAYKVGAYKEDIHEMVEMKDSHFGQMSIYNQPSFHLPYMYNLVGKAWKSQYLVKNLLLNYFSYDFRAFPGDEDNGSMAAWYILSAMGIYPLSPGSGFYELGIGLFDKMEVNLYNDNKLTIRVEENYPHKKFVGSISLDGEKYRQTRISHKDLIKSRELKFSLNLLPEIREDGHENK